MFREINDIRKSFILFEDAESEDEGTKLIKIHYEADSEKEYLLKHFKNEEMNISFTQNKNKYIVKEMGINKPA